MGNSKSKEFKKSEYGEELKQTASKLLQDTEHLLLNSSSKLDLMKKGHIDIRNSIEKDLSSLRNIVNKGGEIKLGVIGRSLNQEKLINSLYLSQAKNDSDTNTFISSTKIKEKNILNNHNLDEELSQTLQSLLTHNLGKNLKSNSNVKLTNYYPTPELINENLITTCSSRLNTLNQLEGSNDLEIEIDDVIKFLLFSALHDMMIYLPERGNLKNEISYLDFIAEDLLILKLLRRNNLYILVDKSDVHLTNDLTKKKLQELILKLGSTVIHELDYADSEKDKIKYLGSMIYKHGDNFAKGATIEEISFIKKKFDEILNQNEYREYCDKIRSEQEEEESKKKKDPKYEVKQIPKKSFNEFKQKYINKMNDIFSTSTGIDKFEEQLFHSFFKIINDKVNLIRSNISFKVFLFDNFSELEMNNDFSNSVIITRNEIVDELNQSFNNFKNILLSEQGNLIKSCDDLMTKIIDNKNLALQANVGYFENTPREAILNLFNIFGNFVPYNKLISQSRKEYFTFNKNIFTTMTKLSNVCFKIFEMLSRTISNKYSSLFAEMQKKQSQTIFEKMMKENNGSYSSSFTLNDFPIEDIVKSKLEKINVISLHLLSIFGFTNFSLREITPWYIFPSYGGASMFLLSLFGTFKLNLPFKVSMYGGGAFVISLLLSYLLKMKYVSDSKSNFEKNIDQLISFLSVKKDKIVEFEKVFDKFCEIYTRETLELIDLISGI
jgi:hypothetical protein